MSPLARHDMASLVQFDNVGKEEPALNEFVK